MNPETTEEDGINAIIWLQNYGGQKETREQAKSGWLAMTSSQRETTMFFYRKLKGES